MIADMIHNKNLNLIVTELIIRGRKRNISLVFITQSYFKVPKDVRLNASHFFIAKIPNKRELQQIAINHSSDISTKDFANIYRKCTDEPYSFLGIYIMLASNYPLRFRKNLFNIECNSIISSKSWQLMIRLKMKNYNMILMEKQLKYQLYHQAKFINMNILLVEIYYQQQIIEQAKFTYYPLGKTFEKQIQTIEDQGKKQVDALENLKPKEETKLIDDKSNNQSKAVIIFNKFINERKDLMKELYDCDDYNNLKFHFVGPTKDVSFYEYGDSKQLFSAIKNHQINFYDVVKKQKEFPNKLSGIKIGKKLSNKKKRLITLKNLIILEKKLLTFLKLIKWKNGS